MFQKFIVPKITLELKYKEAELWNIFSQRVKLERLKGNWPECLLLTN